MYPFMVSIFKHKIHPNPRVHLMKINGDIKPELEKDKEQEGNIRLHLLIISRASAV